MKANRIELLIVEGFIMFQHLWAAGLIVSWMSICHFDRVLSSSPSNGISAENSNTLLQVPDVLKVPSDQRLLFKAAAKGVQIYACKAKANSTKGFEWTLKAPRADLLNNQGISVGKHYAGPTWELKEDGSKVVGTVSAKVNSSQPDAIPLLLLKAKSHQGKGILNAVNWIQRLDTVGGKATETGCDSTREKTELQVPYTANYYFYGTTSP